jgi:hypothetical protein
VFSTSTAFIIERSWLSISAASAAAMMMRGRYSSIAIGWYAVRSVPGA